MQPIYFVTGNEKKLAEAKALIPLIEGIKMELPEIQELDPKKIVQAKLAAAATYQDGTVMVEDISLECRGLNGLPGPLVKWFLQTIGSKGIYDLVRASKDMQVTAVATIGLRHVGRDRFFEGRVSGHLVAPIGKSGFGWDELFMPEGYDVTFGQMPLTQKNTMSHRFLALSKVKAFLDGNI